MALGDSAPYGPPDKIIRTLEQYRETGFAGQPISTASLQKLGFGEEVARRVVMSLKLLELINEEGIPTPPLQAFKAAPSAGYLQILGDHLLASYESVFAFTGRDFTNKTPVELEDAFREFKQASLRKRMVSCFVGLCEYAGIVKGTTKPKPGPKIGTPRPSPRRSTSGDASGATPGARRRTPPSGGQLLTAEAILDSGGSVLVTVNADLVKLSTADRKFAFDLIDSVNAYGSRPALAAGASVADVREG